MDTGHVRVKYLNQNHLRSLNQGNSVIQNELV